MFIKWHCLNFVCSEAPCSCDICSFSKLKEIERTLPPGLPMPYFSSWTTSQFSQTSIHHPTGAHLEPRTGNEQPYWHRPCYFGWQYVTSGKEHVLYVSPFHYRTDVYWFCFPLCRFSFSFFFSFFILGHPWEFEGRSELFYAGEQRSDSDCFFSFSYLSLIVERRKRIARELDTSAKREALRGRVNGEREKNIFWAILV